MPGPKTDDVDDPIVDAVVTKYTSIRGRMLHPGLNKLPRSWAKMLQESGVARPPKKKPDSEAPAPSATTAKGKSTEETDE
jgi:hypothetical protein